ncbi:nucleotidyltransferase family protein [Amycolatopsis thermalba]|uniref:Nucleotidyltransferase family protein n=1 Tax=Amycolatopsis thermalba TaxID=944492 RepID=A0ABY4NR10_9PSEU|nr:MULTISPECIES: nucleotidyltransferase family protein [Amycolatopsis]UQS22267.1 nucleotidyltransferase family protein [Amycolatopsis thermalba]
MGRRLCDEREYPAALLAAAAYRLPGTDRAMPARPVRAEDWPGLLAAARKHRMTGLLTAAIAAGAFPATGAQAREAASAHATNQMRVLVLEHELLRILDLLTGAGIEARVLKGTAVAHLDYPDPALRSFNDLDVLVRAGDIDRTVAVLATAGFRRTLAEPRPGFDRRFDKGMTLRPPAGYELDLHRTFVLGPWGRRVDLDAVWDAGQEFAIGGRAVRALSLPNRFLHACYHAALGDWPLRLGSLRDVAEMLRVVDGNPEPVRRTAASWGAEAVVAAAVADTVRLLGIKVPGELAHWAVGYIPSARDESWLGLHTTPDKTFAAQAVATLRVLPWRDKPAYLRALVFPDARYTAARHRSPLSRFTYALREVRKGSPTGSR